MIKLVFVARNKKGNKRKPVNLSDNRDGIKIKPDADEIEFPSEFDCSIDFGDMDFTMKAKKMDNAGKKATIDEDDVGHIGMRGSKKVVSFVHDV